MGDSQRHSKARTAAGSQTDEGFVDLLFILIKFLNLYVVCVYAI